MAAAFLCVNLATRTVILSVASRMPLESSRGETQLADSATPRTRESEIWRRMYASKRSAVQPIRAHVSWKRAWLYPPFSSEKLRIIASRTSSSDAVSLRSSTTFNMPRRVHTSWLSWGALIGISRPYWKRISASTSARISSNFAEGTVSPASFPAPSDPRVSLRPSKMKSNAKNIEIRTANTPQTHLLRMIRLK